jgi:hypothetical protein
MLSKGSRKMPSDERDLLTVLRAELSFALNGGYQNPTHAQWRPQFIFQDSPACLNHDPAQAPRPCGECVLMQLVPPEGRERKFPCRHIPLNPAGETIASFYRSGTPEELEAALIQWLRAAIHKLEQEKTLVTGGHEKEEVEGKAAGRSH